MGFICLTNMIEIISLKCSCLYAWLHGVPSLPYPQKFLFLLTRSIFLSSSPRTRPSLAFFTSRIGLATTPIRFFLKPMILLMRSPKSGAGAGAGAEEAEGRLTITTTARRHSWILILGWRYLREFRDCQHLNHFN